MIHSYYEKYFLLYQYLIINLEFKIVFIIFFHNRACGAYLEPVESSLRDRKDPQNRRFCRVDQQLISQDQFAAEYPIVNHLRRVFHGSTGPINAADRS